MTGIPCSHAISVIYYNKEKPDNYIDDCYKFSTFLETYRHTLSPTQDRECWPKSDQDPMKPPNPVNKRRDRKTLSEEKK